MLNKFRINLKPLLEKIGLLFASTGLSANFWTFFAFSLAIIASLFFTSNSYDIFSNAIMIGSILLLISGFFDIVDGSVAKVTKKSSKKGAFLDSTFDKISEIIIFMGLAVGNIVDPILCLLGISLSLMVSYTRSRAEAVGVNLSGVGFGERAERILILGVMGILPFENSLHYAVIIIIALSVITIIERIFKTIKEIKE
ncbi:MAG: CDP-alcohol phosphatidyltransferase family protein [Nitrososphaeraceae archaeon]